MVVFDRPVGAQADTKELEYISALHQSGPTLRSDGSIRDEDIKAYLRSRFGIEVTLEEVRQTILQGLGGSDEEGEVIDLMELTAIIIIPLLLKAATVTKGQALPPDVLPPAEKLLELAVKIITHDVTGSSDDTVQNLSPEFVRRILMIYGETEMAGDEKLIQDMIEAARAAGGSSSSDKSLVEFNALSFAEGLTNDVKLYDILNEVRLSTSMQDVFNEHDLSPPATTTDGHHGSSGPKISTSKAASDIGEEGEEVVQKHDDVRQIETLRHIFTAPAIDIQAGTYRSKGKYYDIKRIVGTVYSSSRHSNIWESRGPIALTLCLWGAVLFSMFPIVITGAFPGSGSLAEGSDDEVVNEKQYDSEAGWVENADAMAAQLGQTIAKWFEMFFQFSIVGVLCMGLGSLGNYTGHSRWYLPLIGTVVMATFCYGSQELVSSDSSIRFMAYVSYGLSLAAAYFHLCHFIIIVFRKRDFEHSTWGRRLGLASMGKESAVKKAAAHKLNTLTGNAAKLMQSQRTSSVFKTYFGHGLSAYAVNGGSKESTGGIMWLWHKFLDNSIFEKEGIWYSTRLVASNFAQLCVCIFILLLGVNVCRQVKENYGKEDVKSKLNGLMDYVIETQVSVAQTSSAAIELMSTFTEYLSEAASTGLLGYNCSAPRNDAVASVIAEFCSQNELGTYDCSAIQSPIESMCVLIQYPEIAKQYPAVAYELMEVSGFNTTALDEMVQEQLQGALDESVESLYPEEEYMVMVPLYISTCLAVIAAFRLAILYLPGVTVTILELRSGVIPSLHSPDFQKYREAPDTVTLLTGTLFWGCLVSSILFGLLIGVIVFLFLWQGSYFFMMKFFATLLGVVCVVIIRVLLVMFCCRRSFYKGLYRTRPAAANISLLALEWANFFFTAAFVLIRMFKVLLIAASSIGQIDRKLLADGVGQLGPVEFDPYPTIHVRDLVAHDAHRHPFIEILGTMYLMKLRYAKQFGSRAGSAWRLIFIYALFPWMHQYRISGDAVGNDKDEKSTGDMENTNSTSMMGESQQLPFLAGASETDDRALEIENEKLKKMVKKLNRRLQELQGADTVHE